jgi:signal-transduction protein with cAMP-binding, CBS, and nucleotidyltransferase domain
MKTVNDLIKSNLFYENMFVTPDDSVLKAIEKLAIYDLGAIIVLDHSEVVGIFSEKDYARKLLLKGKSSLTTKVSEVMESKVLYVTPDFMLEDCLALMIHKKIRHLPVLINSKYITLISMEDITAELIELKEFEIANLIQYITGAPVSFQNKFRQSLQITQLIWQKQISHGKAS